MDKQKKKSKILVVDDEEIVRESLQDWLGAYGFDVSIAENGTEALGLIHDQKFDMIILDLRLPDMEGTEVLKETRKFRPELKAIILTAYPSKESTIEAVKQGATEYLVKPFEPEHLVGIINAILSGAMPETDHDFALVGPLYQLVSEWKKQQSDKS